MTSCRISVSLWQSISLRSSRGRLKIYTFRSPRPHWRTLLSVTGRSWAQKDLQRVKKCNLKLNILESRSKGASELLLIMCIAHDSAGALLEKSVRVFAEEVWFTGSGLQCTYSANIPERESMGVFQIKRELSAQLSWCCQWDTDKILLVSAFSQVNANLTIYAVCIQNFKLRPLSILAAVNISMLIHLVWAFAKFISLLPSLQRYPNIQLTFLPFLPSFLPFHRKVSKSLSLASLSLKSPKDIFITQEEIFSKHC